MSVKYLKKFFKKLFKNVLKGDILLKYAYFEISNYMRLYFLLLDVKKNTETHCHIISGK